MRRQNRVITRFLDRAKNRDPELERDLYEMFSKDIPSSSLGQLMSDPTKFKADVSEDTRIFREYMAKESVQQYKDYYESDKEEQSFFEYLQNLPNRDNIRFMEIFKDFTIPTQDHKDYVTIPKREYNAQLSVFSNLMLDLVDFKDRVRPMAKDISLLEVSRRYQKVSPSEIEK